MYNILICDDEKDIINALKIYLNNPEYQFYEACNGKQALEIIEREEIHLVLLDIMMPVMDGTETLAKLRQFSNVPVIFLTAKREEVDMILGLNMGADDYITKPFDTRELLARIRVLTRSQQPADSKLHFGNISLDRANFVLSTSTGSFRLANKEYQMMEMLMSNPGILISSERFMEKIWGYETDTEINVVWVYISYLRKKLTALEANIQIRSSRNAGYTLEEIR